MPEPASVPAVTTAFAAALEAARDALAARVDEVNDINVFPVADGDTGTNLLLTISAVAEAAAEEIDLEGISRAALTAARGNSGMILSQVIRGATEALNDGEIISADAVRAAFRAAADTSYAAVRNPVEGTMLTVARRMAEGAERTGDETNPLEVLRAALAAGWRGVEETTGLLEQLKTAGVVDSGALGLVVMADGIAACAEGREIVAAGVAERVSNQATEHMPSRYRYCTTFLIEGGALDLEKVEDELEPVGDSILVIGDSARCKVHVHTDEPLRVAEIAGVHGDIEALNYDDMRRQEAERAARLAGPSTAVGGATALMVPAQAGGISVLVAGLGAVPLPVAAVLPSAEEIAEAANETGADEVLILSHDAAFLTLARGAAGLAENIRVEECPSFPALLSGLVGFDPGADAEANAAAVKELAEDTSSAEITATGDGYLAESGGATESFATLRDAVSATVSALGGGGDSLVTLILGASVDDGEAEVEAWAREGAPEAEIEAHAGGQESPTIWIGVE